MKKKISITISNKALENIDSIIDNINIRNRSQAIELLVFKSLGSNKTAVILSGGSLEKQKLSENQYRLTARIKDKTLVEMAISKLRENDFKKIIIIAPKDVLTNVFHVVRDGSDYGVSINYIEEKSANGTADSLRHLKGKINSEFLVLFNDLIFDRIHLKEIWKDHLINSPLATIMLTTSPDVSKKGICKVEGKQVIEFNQKPKKSDSNLVFSPIFITDPRIFEYKGFSLEDDIFPKIAKEGLLNGYMSHEKEIHIHSLEDIKKLKG